ncbi:MAG: hypothetical protein KGL11_14350 [Alphaproteobacteria bacterium]|nr:hypothetical protein [Alphaproteobacteria bacterium]
MMPEPRERHEHECMSDERRILISKLRWMGLEQEADRLTASSEMPAAVTQPAETD